ncbi:MAG: mercuric reductase [Acidobacteriota bacterium]|nr:mercuric reductase [Acidobacteriota bacterium]
MGHADVLPRDEHNERLLDNVHPADWVSPEPRGRYNMVVIGGGTAGLVTAAASAGLGARVALVERALLGGDCLNYGCVPSKAILRAARAAADARGAGEFGVRVDGEVRVDFAAVMQRMRRLRASISRHDSAERFGGLGVDVYLGEARFASEDAVEVDGRRLTFRRACIATGARASAPPIRGLADAGYLTNETVFSLTELPRRLAVIGAGPIGCELAQAFARFGSQVLQFEALPRILIKDDLEAAEIVRSRLVEDGVDLHVDAKVAGVERAPGGKRVRVQLPDGERSFDVDEILVAVGRAPNVGSLNLEAAGVEYDKRKGVKVDDRLRTTNSRVFAAGDICTPFQFTHTADFMARIVIKNALFMGRGRMSDLVIPWATYTDPELAHVGLYPEEAERRGIETETLVQRFADVDRAVLDGDEEGFAKVYVGKKGRIVGATVLARHAGDLIGELSLAMTAGVRLGSVANAIHPYPTQAEAIRKLGDAYNKTRLTPRVQWLMEKWFKWTR